MLIPGWDTILHTINGFICGAVGFSLICLLNRNSRNISLSPLCLTLVAFCFSMTVGILWEFFEFAMDCFFLADMQKDFIISRFGSVTLDPSGLGTPAAVRDITETLITTASGETFRIKGGYLDIGIMDTMKDLIVNFLGAAVFSLIGYAALKSRRYEKLTEKLTVKPAGPEEETAEQEEILRKKEEYRKRKKRRRS